MIRNKIIKIKNQFLAILPESLARGIHKISKIITKGSLFFVPYHFREDTMFSNIHFLKELGFCPDLIVDVGAYKGEWTESVLRIFPSSSYVMVEPQDSKAEGLIKLSKKHANVNYVTALVSSRRNEVVKFYEVETGSSIYQEKIKNNLEGKDYTTETLDFVLQHYSSKFILLKLDVQGAEIDVLKGAKETLLNTQFILMEVSLVEYNDGAPLFTEVIAFMDTLGYQTFDVCEIHRSKEKVAFQVDIIFIKEGFTIPSND